VAAVIFYLQQDVLGISVGKESATRKKKASEPSSQKARKKTATERKKDLIDIILERASKEELAHFVRDLAETDGKFASLLRHAFTHYNEEQSVKGFASDLHNLLKSIIGRDHYNTWRKAPEAGQAASAFVTSAEIQHQRGHSLTAAMMALGAVEALTKAIEYIDDSDGYLGGSIHDAIGLLSDIAASVPEPAVEDLIREYCLAAYKKKVFEHWDWHYDMIDIVSRLMNSTDEANELIQLLKGEIHAHYDQNRVTSLIHSIYVDSGQIKAAAEFRDAHLNLESMRNDAVLEAVEEGRFDEAIDLLKQGIVQDEPSKQGLAEHWRSMLLDVYEGIGDIDAATMLCTDMFMDSHYFDAKLFEKLKKWIPESAWPDVVNNMLMVLKARYPMDGGHMRKKIYVQEEMWDDLLQIVTQQMHISYLDEYDAHLGPRFPEEWGNYIFETVMQEAAHANNRRRYESIAQVLVKLFRAGRDEAVLRVVAALRKLYRHRPAMLETLAQF
jgi:hypothetical protein